MVFLKVVTLRYISTTMLEGVNPQELGNFEGTNQELTILMIYYLFATGFIFTDLKLSKTSARFFSLFKWVEYVGIILVDICLLSHRLQLDWLNGSYRLTIPALATFFLMASMVQYLQASNEMAFYTELLEQTIDDVKYFLVLFLLLLLPFSSAIYILNDEREYFNPDESIIGVYTG